MAIEKHEYTEYTDTVTVEGEETNVIVQVPKDPDLKVHVILQSGRRWLRFTLDEFSGINQIVKQSLDDSGWQEELSPKSPQ